jgi:hypothetical protein
MLRRRSLAPILGLLCLTPACKQQEVPDTRAVDKRALRDSKAEHPKSAPSGLTHAQTEVYLSRPTVALTAVDGRREIISGVVLSGNVFGDVGGGEVGECFEIVTSKSPLTEVWVHLSQIKLANFQQSGNAVRISLALENGKNLDGVLVVPRAARTIEGKGELGNVQHSWKSVRSMEFLKFETGMGGGGPLIDREDASARWNASRKAAAEWAITSGDLHASAPSFGIVDRYNVGTVSFVDADYTSSGDVREGYLLNRIKVQRGASRVDTVLSDLQEIEITGKTRGGYPECVVTTKGGNSMTVSVLATSRYEDQGADFDRDDMLVWQTPYGYQGLSFLPRRQIIIHKEISVGQSQTDKRR